MYYEDLVFDPAGTMAAIRKLGWRCDPDFINFTRGQREMSGFNEQRYPSLIGRLEYGSGNFRSRDLTTEFADLGAQSAGDEVGLWCPALVGHYISLVRERGEKWIQKDEWRAPPFKAL
jgi:hypothetical protein